MLNVRVCKVWRSRTNLKLHQAISEHEEEIPQAGQRQIQEKKITSNGQGNCGSAKIGKRQAKYLSQK